MRAEILRCAYESTRTVGCIVGILYTDDEISQLIESGIDDYREKLVPDREAAEKFCRRWNRQYAGESAIDIIRRRGGNDAKRQQLDMFAG